MIEYSVDLFHAILLLDLLLISAAWSLARPSFLISIVLGLLSIAWLFLNQPLEGRILLVFSPRNGLTESDLLVVLGLGLAVVAAVRRARRGADAGDH